MIKRVRGLLALYWDGFDPSKTPAWLGTPDAVAEAAAALELTVELIIKEAP